MTAIGSLAGSLGAEIEQPALLVAELGEGEAAAVADVRIVHAELMAVITQRQELAKVLGQRLETAEMPGPFLVARVQPDALCPALIEKAGNAFAKVRRFYRVVESGTQIEDRGLAPIWRRIGGLGHAPP